jgi:hypothetical protein
MTGTTLYPLNALKEVYPAAFEMHVQKYIGRQRLMREIIPCLDCLWNDVLFMSAVHPKGFCKAYYNAGFPRLRPMRFFRIDPRVLEERNIAVLTGMGVNQPRGYAQYRRADLSLYASIPNATYAYWESERLAGNSRPFLWMHIPHILYKGTIETSGLEIVEG